MHVLSANKYKRKLLAFAAGTIVALTGLAVVGTLSTSKVLADCSNDIMCGGFTTRDNFVNKVRSSNDSTHREMQAIYAHDFLGNGESLPNTAASYDDFARHAVAGWANRETNTITLTDGTVVATEAKSVGHLKSVQGADPMSYSVGGETLWGNYNSKAIASSSSRLPVWVLLDTQGKFQFAVMQTCGNPTFGKPKPSRAECNDLKANKVNDTTYDYVADTTVTGNATLKKLVYSFGDGSSPVTVTNPADFGKPVRHPYAQTGASQSFTASVTVYVSVPGRDTFALSSTSLCKHKVTIPPKPQPPTPFYSCQFLKPFTVDEQKRIYKYVATAHNGNGAVFTKTEYNFGDGTAVQVVTSADHKTTTVTHPFSQNKDYNVSALLHFTVNGKDVTATHKCTANRTTSTCKPGVPVDDVRCNPCPSNPAVSADDTEHCITEAAVTSLPNTGAGNTIAIFAAVVVAGFLGYRHVLFRRHRAAFLAAQHGVSPLPLGDPLNDEAPLSGTPLAPKRRSFRRKRPF